MITAMDSRLPLPALLSQVLVAFTVEFDNEAERRLPHRTTAHGRTEGWLPAPWLASMVMWLNCMRFVDEGGITLRELERRARTPTNLHGMQRWGYVKIAPDPADTRPKPPRGAWLIRATRSGKQAREIWQPLGSQIEKRWVLRFGGEVIDRLSESLAMIAAEFDSGLPDCLPILKYGLLSAPPDPLLPPLAPGEVIAAADLPLHALLARVLLAFAIEFERESAISLAICADLLRVLDDQGVRVRDIPVLSGVSKEAISMGMGILKKVNLAHIVAGPAGSPWKVVRLTRRGLAAKDAYVRLVADLEDRWRTRFGNDVIARLREALEELVGDPAAGPSPLFEGLEPHPGNWRASLRKPEVLPHYPMVLHRGGYPDGS